MLTERAKGELPPVLEADFPIWLLKGHQLYSVFKKIKEKKKEKVFENSEKNFLTILPSAALISLLQ